MRANCVTLLFDIAGMHGRVVDLDASASRDESRISARIAGPRPRGIPPHELEAISIEPETDLEHASRLVLWLVRWGVESIDGEIEFAEGEEAGTAVHIRLPRQPSPG